MKVKHIVQFQLKEELTEEQRLPIMQAFKAQPTNPVGRVYGRQPKTVAKRYIISPKVSTFAL